MVRTGKRPTLIVEGQVDGAVLHGVVQVVVAADDHLHVDLGIFFRELRNGLRKFAAVVALVAAQSKGVAVIRVQPLGLPDKLLQVAANNKALAVKMLPGRREAEGAVMPVQKLHSQLVLQLFDLLGNRRLGHMALFCGSVEAAAFYNRL